MKDAYNDVQALWDAARGGRRLQPVAMAVANQLTLRIATVRHLTPAAVTVRRDT